MTLQTTVIRIRPPLVIRPHRAPLPNRLRLLAPSKRIPNVRARKKG